MPSYSTVTGESASTVTMGAGSSLFRKLVSVGAGFTVTGWDLDLRYGGGANAAATGLPVGTPAVDLQLKYAVSYGPSAFAPPALIGNEDLSSVLWYTAGEDIAQLLIAPASSTWQSELAWRMRISSRYQFRLPSASDFCLQIGNNNTVAEPFSFTATLRVSFA